MKSTNDINLRIREIESNNAKVDVVEQSSQRGVHRFAHSAMATVFEIYCDHPDARYAAQAAREAFDLVDRLEQDLSRFRSNSDISRINSLEAGESTQVSPWTFECLEAAWRLYFETEKTFDVAIGTGFDSLELDTGTMAVRALASGVRLDLGGIGKGYTVDRVAELLEEWEINRVLLHGGFSSVLIADPPQDRSGWPITLSRPGTGEREVLARISSKHQVFSASGIRKGDHIVDPRDGRAVLDRLAAWVSLPRGQGQTTEAATIAEGLSTAFMILDPEEVAACCGRRSGLEAWLVTGHSENGPGETKLLHFPGS